MTPTEEERSAEIQSAEGGHDVFSEADLKSHQSSAKHQ